MKNCLKCNETLYHTAKEPICITCRKKENICQCGNKKDWRADDCRNCASSKGAKAQWQRMRPTMLREIGKACIRRRRTFATLKWEDFKQIKHDGRRYAYYWTEDGKYRTMYRYQWVWIKHNGPIPKGYIIHHIDDVCFHDEIENLQMLTQSEHMKLHGETMQKAKWVCQHCKKVFAKSPRGGTGVRKFCSQSCHYEYARQLPKGAGYTCHTVERVSENRI